MITTSLEHSIKVGIFKCGVMFHLMSTGPIEQNQRLYNLMHEWILAKLGYQIRKTLEHMAMRSMPQPGWSLGGTPRSGHAIVGQKGVELIVNRDGHIFESPDQGRTGLDYGKGKDKTILSVIREDGTREELKEGWDLKGKHIYWKPLPTAEKRSQVSVSRILNGYWKEGELKERNIANLFRKPERE